MVDVQGDFMRAGGALPVPGADHERVLRIRHAADAARLLDAVGRGGDREALALKDQLRGLADVVVVLHDEHGDAHGRPCVRVTS